MSDVDLNKIAAILKETSEPFVHDFFEEPLIYEFDKPVVPKGRPRVGRGGKVFTPPETRKFEQEVREWGFDCGLKPVAYPIRVSLVFFDKTDDPTLRLHSLTGITYHTHGDLDNYAKAVLDGLNKVAYKDDKQIVELALRRRYSMRHGFRMSIGRAGLTALEYKNLLKRL